jgi:tetratricopeptide (TPR) repeat protein
VWQELNRGGGDSGLASDIASALVREPRSGGLHNALGLILAAAGRSAHEVATYFARAVERDPGHILARLNWVEALVVSGQKQEAAAQAERALKLLDEGNSIRADVLDSGHYPVQFDFFRVEWERAAWRNAGDPRAEASAKAGLLRWRLHALLAEMTGDLSQHHEAVLARPDLGSTQAVLGCALANSGRMGPAVIHLRRAVNDNPFDHQAAQALFQVLGAAGEGAAQRRLADARRLLARAGPKLVPMEPWMERVPTAGR